MTRTTLKDVAQRAGVSTATASKALSGRGEIAEQTRQAVVQAADDLAYMPQRRPGAEQGRATAALITDSIDSYYGVEILRGLVEEGFRRGIDIVPHIESHQSPQRLSAIEWERAYLRPATIGIVTVVYAVEGPVFEVARRRRIPVIAIDPYLISRNATVTISSTNWEGGRTATEHLIDLGHRRIALINGTPSFIPGIDRYHGYRAGLADAGIEPDDSLLFDGQYTFGSGFDAAERILELPNRPTAVFALSDRMALGAIRAFESHGVRVPADISVIGFDNSPGTELMTPALTTIRQPMADMGRLAVQVLQNIAAGNPSHLQRIKLAATLVVRSSTAPPR
ncbi:LacI family DNA-binding transcriptional regulator [Brooklawnia cerclae]|uniref:LacI family transcriptional regulator n=1 Tax=Brooklawnia cerclae TaxID=349934 RepID=A0ABX0SJP2_9ACTN|nr:LacI family transcriptional regulator [Brooklawnia cerclae]